MQAISLIDVETNKTIFERIWGKENILSRGKVTGWQIY